MEARPQSYPAVQSAIEPSRAGIREVFPTGVSIIWCLVCLPPDAVPGQLILEFKDMADDLEWHTRMEGSVATWHGRVDGLYCAGAGHEPAWPPGRYRWRVHLDDRFIGEAFLTVIST
jgi:hypothetical protein